MIKTIKNTPSRHLTGLVMAAALVTLTSCDSSSSSADNPGNDQDLFANSDAMNERFGTKTSRELEPQTDEATRTALVSALNDFSLTMHQTIASGAPNEGSVESGLSAALALLLTSAATGGDTYAGLRTLLGIDALDEDSVHTAVNELSLMLESRANDDLVLLTANRVFVKPELDLQTQFLDRATGDYGAPVTEADFANAPQEVADEINGWVSQQTNDFIPTIVDQLPTNTVFAILNAIFLDAKWKDTYDSTGERSFNTIDGSLSTVEYFGGRSDLPRLVRDDLTAIEIPYGGDEVAMLIMMPDSLDSFEASLNAESLSEIVNSMETRDVTFNVPNWEQSSELDLMDLLAPAGLPASPWDFERLVNGGTGLDVIARQRAKIEVDKDGTRAAAVTLVAGIESIGEFITIDQPFAYVLRDRTTGVVLFTGRVVAP